MELSFKVKCRSVFPECCAVLLSNGRGLGRSLSYVGRNQISLFAMLHEALVHELPCEAILSFCMELSCQSCLAELVLKLLHGAAMQKLPFEAIS